MSLTSLGSGSLTSHGEVGVSAGAEAGGGGGVGAGSGSAVGAAAVAGADSGAGATVGLAQAPRMKTIARTVIVMKIVLPISVTSLP